MPFGDGTVDFEAVLRLFNRLGYNGSYTVEMWTSKAADPIAEVTASKAYFDGLFERVGITQEPILRKAA